MKLFQPDNFSDEKIRYKKINDAVLPFGQILKRYFNDFEIKEIFKLDRVEINSQNYKLVININAKEKKFLLRKYKTLSNIAQINFYLTILKKLKEKSVPVSRIVETVSGQLSVRVGDDTYSLFEFIKADYFKPTKKGFISVAEAVAKMHYAFNQLGAGDMKKVNSLSKQGYTYFNKIRRYSLSDFKKIEGIIFKKKEKSDIDKIVLEKIPLFIKIAKKVQSQSKKIASLPKQIIHSDLHPHNILMNGDNLAAIVDFDALRISQQARDVAFATYRLGRQFLVKKPEAKNLFLECQQLVDLFVKSYNALKPLSSQEIFLMPLLLKDEFLRKNLFVLNGVYRENNLTWEKDLPKFLIAMDEINYFWPDSKIN